jgi:hypothetical protein
VRNAAAASAPAIAARPRGAASAVSALVRQASNANSAAAWSALANASVVAANE